MSEDILLKDRVALVTGASRGLGRAIAISLARNGAKVAINYLSNDTEANKVAEAIQADGGETMMAKGSIADGTFVKDMVKQVVKQWGKLDILVNNAGITRDNLLPRMADEAWDEVMNTNLRGAYLCTKFAVRPMMEQSWGRIINIASLAGVIGNMGQANYSASKGGLIAFTKSVAREVGSRKITANVIAPGFIVTDMTGKLPQEAKDNILTRIPLKRFGTPDDIASLAVFLAGESAGYITAQVICVDGGVI
ncbi:MAG: 3-oxoacyl-[acyl-carrier-protein] reductase [Dehalococcoidales bacterium]|nr:3-oxoacyl-[acyl-carrier-protein] reductase [Dehalococcoidales bacterium]